MRVASEKVALAIALCDIDSPKYLEAIQLTNAAFDTSRHVLGPDHEITVNLKKTLEDITEDYRGYREETATGLS